MREKLLFLKACLMKQIITKEQAIFLFDKDITSIRSLVSILEREDLMIREELFTLLLPISNASFLISLMEDSDFFHQNTKKCKFLLLFSDNMWLEQIVKLIQFDFIFENEFLLSRMTSVWNSTYIGYQKVFKSILESLLKTSDFFSLEENRPILEQSFSFSKLDVSAIFLKYLTFPELRLEEVISKFYQYYRTIGKKDFSSCFSFFRENHLLPLLVDKIKKIEPEDISSFSNLLSNLEQCCCDNQDLLRKALDYVDYDERLFSSVLRYFEIENGELSQQILYQILTFPKSEQNSIFHVLDSSLGKVIEADVLENLKGFDNRQLRSYFMRLAIDFGAIDYIEKEKSYFEEVISDDVLFFLTEVDYLEERLDNASYLFDGEKFTLSLDDTGPIYKVSEDYHLPSFRKTTTVSSTPVKKKSFLSSLFKKTKSSME